MAAAAVAATDDGTQGQKPVVTAQPLHYEPGKGRIRQDAAGSGDWPVLRPKSRPERLILPLYPANFCSPGPGADETVRNNVPLELKSRGVTDYEWITCMQSLESSVQTQQCPCGTFGSWSCLAFLLPVPCIAWYAHKYQSAMESWLARLNAEVLEPKGMYASTQTTVYTQNKHHEEVSWLAIGMTSEEVQALKWEPHIWSWDPGYPWCKSCGCPETNGHVPMGLCCARTLGCVGRHRVV